MNGLSSSIFITRNQSFVFAASQQSTVLTVIDNTNGGDLSHSAFPVSTASASIPADRSPWPSSRIPTTPTTPASSLRPKTLAYSGGSSTWPKAAVDCEPQNAPGWCLFQMQSPDSVDATGNAYGAPLVFDRPVKAVFSADGSTAYVLNCGAECGGSLSSLSQVPVRR